jgi:DNA repair protein RadC
LKNENPSIFQVTEVELTYRNKVNPRDRININSASGANEILQFSWDQNRIDLLEEFKIVLLSRSNACLGISEVAIGGSTACHVDPKIVFAIALKANAAAIILAHNHPSGQLKPSEPDIAMTNRLFLGGKLLNVDVLDHLIITRHGFYSMADNHIMPK